MDPLSLKRILNAGFVLVALVVTGLVARHFAHTGWPLHRANIWLVPSEGEPKRLTSFQDQNIGTFQFAPDGRIVFTRFVNIRDAVLIRNLE